MKLATTTAEFGEPVSSLAENITFFAGTGFRHLDVSFYRVIYPGSPFMSDDWERWVMAGYEAAQEGGFSLCQAHSPTGSPKQEGEALAAFMQGTIRSIEACGMLGIPHIVVHACDPGGYPSSANHRYKLELNRDYYRQLMPAMERTGVRVLLENGLDGHAPTPDQNRRTFPATAAELLELRAFIDHPLIDVCWDTGHGNLQKLDQYESIMELGPALRGVHIADNNGDVDSHISPLQGTLNIDSVMQGLLDSGYQGYFTFEASRMLHGNNDWPHFRRKWSYKGAEVNKLAIIPQELRWHNLVLQYQIGKHILSTYNCFEE